MSNNETHPRSLRAKENEGDSGEAPRSSQHRASSLSGQLPGHQVAARAADANADVEQPDEIVIRFERSNSEPTLALRRRTSRLQSFVAGLVADVEEYAGRGGYEVTPDDREDGGPGCSAGSSNTSERGGYTSDMESPLLGRAGGLWRRFGDRDGGVDAPVGLGWMQSNESRHGELPAPDPASLSEVTLKSPDDGAPQNQTGQDLLVRRARSFSSSQYGGNSVTRTVVTYLKGMMGSYVLYLPRMFAEGGMLFSSVAVVVVSVTATYNMLLLLRCRESLVHRGVSACSYGEVARAALGRVGWVGVDVSLFCTQLGYCVVYLIFVQQNLGPLVRRAFPSQPSWLTGTIAILMVQACIQVPLSWVRRLKYLGAGMLVANACVFGGLLIILFEVARKLSDDGLAGENTGGKVVLINPADCLILLGSVVGCFEGIGLVLPIQDAMDLKVRHKLPAALCWSMAGITVFFVSFGAAGYLAYGRDVANFITMDLPEGSVAGTTVRLMYSIGLVLTSPLQLFPAVKVLERIVWPVPARGPPKKTRSKKWLKNLLRSVVVAFTVLVALVAGSRFDSFTGIVGGVCAVPLALIYPPLFHMSLFGETDTPRQRVLHWALLVGGVVSGVASTVTAVMAL
eukprot:g7851.t1